MLATYFYSSSPDRLPRKRLLMRRNTHNDRSVCLEAVHGGVVIEATNLQLTQMGGLLLEMLLGLPRSI